MDRKRWHLEKGNDGEMVGSAPLTQVEGGRQVIEDKRLLQWQNDFFH